MRTACPSARIALRHAQIVTLSAGGRGRSGILDPNFPVS